MKTRLSIAVLTCGLTAAGFSAESQPKVDAIVAAATRDPKTAPLAVALAAGENPEALGQIVTGALAALPSQTLDIVRTLLEVMPKQRTEILRAAIMAQPKLAVEIVSMVLAMFPNQTAEIMKTAIEAAPENLRTALAALGNKVVSFETTAATGSRPARATFPTQPLRPDLIVSPSN
jgi:hypothetical protein